MWCDIRSCDMLLAFLELFFNKKCDVTWGDFLEWLELFFKRKVICRDVTCYLNFYNYFSMEKCDVAWGDFLKFLELFFNRERWHDMVMWHAS
jgi:hypothetical protein